jgi:diaminopimelate decarboxylase
MNHFDYCDGELACEGVRLSDIAREVGTPVYVYSTATLERHYAVFSQALAAQTPLWSTDNQAPLVAFAVKANANIAVLKVLANQGSGADTVSMGEIIRALKAGIAPEKIVFSGVGKTDEEMAFALKTRIYQINVESRVELLRLSKVAAELSITAPVTLRINPKVGAGGHAKITTGGASDKFGISAEEAISLYAEAANLPFIKPVGLSCHIGSQIVDLAPLKQAFGRMKTWVETLRDNGFTVERLDLGGGLGVPYFHQKDPPEPQDFADMAAQAAGGLGVRYTFEPGRLIAANAGVLLSKVIHVHERKDSGQAFLVIDAAMNDLLRPALYEAFHDIRPVRQAVSQDLKLYDVVGPVCETGDTFAREREMGALCANDLVAFMTAGAYGAVMSSEYNTRPRVPEVLVSGDQYAVIRQRASYEAILAQESIPTWLEP